MLLVVVLLIGLLPMDVLAEEYQNTISSTTDVIMKPAVEIVEEIKQQRTEHSKQFKLSNGLYMAAVYPDAVHYQTENGWADIDNTLTARADGTYGNTAGVWDVRFPQQLTQSNRISITKDGYTLQFGMAGELRQDSNISVMSGITTSNQAGSVLAVAEASSANAQIRKVEAQHNEKEPEELVLDKLSSRVEYADVYSDTDIVYDLQSNRVKESVVIHRYSSALRGYQYYLDTGDLVPVLSESGRIDFYDPKMETVVMTMPAPFLVDDALVYNQDVRVTMEENGDGYMLTYLLPQQWLAAEDRAWPVILDPIVSAEQSPDNIRDHTIREIGTFDYKWGIVECGYYSGQGATRFFMKYASLPELSSADLVVSAAITLYKPYNSSDSAPVEVHKVEGTWESETLTWQNKPNYTTGIEDFAIVSSSGYYTWDITDIVRGWYSGENTGMMFKSSDAVESAQVNNYKQFYSSDWGYYKPSLVISYRNNNGLEGYWDYTASSAGRAGTGYVHNYTGNIVWIRGDIGFGGARMPVSISHVYNANDKGNNDFGLGYGWRTNYNQRLYQWSVDSSYYVWEDADGTNHCFKADDAGVLRDEDGLELILTTSGSGTTTYCITDKKGNKSFFDSYGRLTKQQNNQATPSSITVTYTTTSENLISTITDGAGRVYSFTYSGDLLSRISFKGTGSSELSYVTFGYSHSRLTTVTDKDGKACSYGYNSSGLLISAADIDGYKLAYEYNTVTVG